MPLVSVITPVYRAESFIPGLVHSLATQRFTDFEWICVDDSSPDHSIEALASAVDDRLTLKLVRLPVNAGPGTARNAGLRAAAGRYVAFLDADDLWLPDKLQRQVDFMLQHGHHFTFHDYRRMSFDGASIGATVCAPRVVDWAMLHKRRGIGCSTVMLERSFLPEDLFPSRDSLGSSFIHEDFAAWARILRAGIKAHRLPLDLARYRVGTPSLSANKFRGARSVWHIYRSRERIPLLRCAWYFSNYLFFASLIRLTTRPTRFRRARTLNA